MLSILIQRCDVISFAMSDHWVPQSRLDAVVLADSEGKPLYANKIARNILDIEDDAVNYKDKAVFKRLKISDIIEMKNVWP